MFDPCCNGHLQDKAVQSKSMDDTELQNLLDKTSRLVFEEDRLDTFNKNWKELKGFKHCIPKNFAAAGFYNVSSNKYTHTVKCFACQKELSDWEKEDDPWQEHVKRGSQCPFVLFKSKKTTTMEDFLLLQYGVKKNVMKTHFDSQRDLLKEKEKILLKTIDALQKSKN